ncbi:unnamed protein product, partial [Scytosiphon promiscuus]
NTDLQKPLTLYAGVIGTRHGVMCSDVSAGLGDSTGQRSSYLDSPRTPSASGVTTAVPSLGNILNHNRRHATPSRSYFVDGQVTRAPPSHHRLVRAWVKQGVSSAGMLLCSSNED